MRILRIPCLMYHADRSAETLPDNGRHPPQPERPRRAPHSHSPRQTSLQSRRTGPRRIHVVLRMFQSRGQNPAILESGTNCWAAYVQSIPRRPGTPRAEAPLGPLSERRLAENKNHKIRKSTATEQRAFVYIPLQQWTGVGRAAYGAFTSPRMSLEHREKNTRTFTTIFRLLLVQQFSAL